MAGNSKDLQIADIEAMWLEIRTKNHKFLLCVIYRPPNFDDSFWDLLQDNIDIVKQTQNCKVMIVGDLNADPPSRQGGLLMDFATVNNFTLHIDQPTRITSNSSTIVDQCMTNFSTYIKQTKVIPPLCTNDHCTIVIHCLFRARKPRSYARTMWDFNKTDFDKFRKELDSTSWDDCLDQDLDFTVQKWTEKFLQICKRIIPNKNVQIRPNDKSWFTGHLRRLNRRKKRLFNHVKHTGSHESWENFKLARNTYQSELKLAKQNYDNHKYQRLADTGTKNSKKWWTLLKQVYKNNDIHEGIPPLEVDNKILNDDRDKAEAFNDFFLSVTSLDDSNKDLPDDPQIMNIISLDSLHVTENDVLDQIKCLDVNKSYGPDGISPRIIKEAGRCIYV